MTVGAGGLVGGCRFGENFLTKEDLGTFKYAGPDPIFTLSAQVDSYREGEIA